MYIILSLNLVGHHFISTSIAYTNEISLPPPPQTGRHNNDDDNNKIKMRSYHENRKISSIVNHTILTLFYTNRFDSTGLLFSSCRFQLNLVGLRCCISSTKTVTTTTKHKLWAIKFFGIFYPLTMTIFDRRHIPPQIVVVHLPMRLCACVRTSIG